ncbi:MAG: class I SAM-dependent DNA methyltransferase [Phycisphaerales bacterium]
MAIRKTELYASLWASCDELRGGMDASQYKDYVLALLFIKYVSDKYAGKPYADIAVPEGASFADMVKLKGKIDIGDQINKKIVAPLWKANHLNEPPDFDDPNRLGSGKEKSDRLTNLVSIFEDSRLDFTTHRAGDDDLLGDAYEYLMRHFATESGKSKGQFYTPAEVSRIMAKVLGIGQAKTTADTTVYDPTCGSGSLLLRVADEAGSKVSIYGQEKDATTSNLARMNMILHDWAHADIRQGNTLSDPKLKDGDTLKTFDYVVANPPFSDKRWSTGFDPEHDEHGRFAGFGVPPAKQGDYAYLLHIVRSLKPNGVGCCILPHGVLFRGHAEAEIRTNLLKRGYIKGIIGLPPNLFYGTGIPACIVVVDKRDAKARLAEGGGVYMIDASKGFMKDGPKNRLRSRDIHRIVDAFAKLETIDKYARMVPLDEIERNEHNLNIPRYIDASEPEDLQDIDAHLNGGIPERDIDALERYWAVCPGLRDALFTPRRPGYVDLAVDPGEIRQTIREHAEFKAFTERMAQHFEKWRTREAKNLKAIKVGDNPKAIIHRLSEGLLEHYWGQPLVDAYGVYQILMDYWADVMQDDCYTIAGDGWVAEPRRVLEKAKSGKQKGRLKDVGWACDLVPKEFIVARYFATEQAAIDDLGAKLEQAEAELAEFEEEHGGDEGLLADLDGGFSVKAVNERLKELKDAPRKDSEKLHLQAWKAHDTGAKAIKKDIKAAEATLDAAALAKYGELGEDDVRALVVDDKWMGAMDSALRHEIRLRTLALVERVSKLGDRYDAALPELLEQSNTLEQKVSEHLDCMGYEWAKHAGV